MSGSNFLDSFLEPLSKKAVVDSFSVKKRKSLNFVDVPGFWSVKILETFAPSLASNPEHWSLVLCPPHRKALQSLPVWRAAPRSTRNAPTRGSCCSGRWWDQSALTTSARPMDVSSELCHFKQHIPPKHCTAQWVQAAPVWWSHVVNTVYSVHFVLYLH